MPEEDVDLAKGKDNPLAEVGLPTTVKKVAVQRPQEQQKSKVALRGEGHTSEEGVM